MASESKSKINQLLKVWPSGTVAVSSWLETHGVYQQLAHEYEKTAWIERIGHGAFVRSGDKVKVTGGIFALQAQLGLSIHPGGKTALELQGYAHFLPMGKEAPFHLFGKPNEKLPAWFRKYNWERKIEYKTTRLFSNGQSLGITEKSMGPFEILISAPERAIMEVLHLVPQEQSFEEAKLLMEGLTTLRPKLVQNLLESCHSVKVKRLFMFLAEDSNHQWVKRLDLSKIDLGKGKRTIEKGGHFDSKYNITILG